MKIKALEAYRGQRVKIFGWIHRLRRQGKAQALLSLCREIEKIQWPSKFGHRMSLTAPGLRFLNQLGAFFG